MIDTSAVTLATPDGDFTLLVRDGAVLASGWTDDVGGLVALVHPTLRPAVADVAVVPARDAAVASAVDAVVAYYDGDLAAPRAVAVRQASGEFRMQAWDALRDVVAGERLTYTQYAARAGRPLAVRAAAGACALNAAALFVPCHRVVRTDGGLGGFRYGLPVKRRLLDREAAVRSDGQHGEASEASGRASGRSVGTEAGIGAYARSRRDSRISGTSRSVESA